MGKRVRFEDEARQSLWRGADQLASAVRITLGPRGRSVVLDRLHGVPAITRDGVAVAQEVVLADPFENLGAQMLREGAFRTAQMAGDGTSTATVLAHRMLREGLLAEAAGAHPTVVQRGLEQGVAAALEALARAARPVGSARDLERVAVIAAGERALGELVAHALERVGRAGNVVIEEGRGVDTTLDVVEGARFAGGYASPYFVTDADDMEAALEHPLVMLSRAGLETAGEVAPALAHAVRLARPLLVVAPSITGEALATLVVNRLRGTAAAVGVTLAEPEVRHDALFEDLALLTGGSVVSPELGRPAARFEEVWFGRARHVAASMDETTLLQGGGRLADVTTRVRSLEARLGRLEHESERGLMRWRLGLLAGAVAVVRVGAASDFEREARRARLEDALSATRSALEEGVVPGGGLALLRAGEALRSLGSGEPVRAGIEAVRVALAEPARQIGVNAGEDGDSVVARMREGEGAFGFNAISGGWGDLEAQGILDAAKVARCALMNAASVSGMVLTTDAVVVDDSPDPEDGAAA